MVVAKLVIVKIVGYNHAMIGCPTSSITGVILRTERRWQKLHMILKHHGRLRVHEHSLRKIKIALWAQICQIIYWFVAEVPNPFWLVIFVSFIYIERIRFNIYWYHFFAIHCHHLKTWLFSGSVELIWSNWTDNKVHTYWLLLYHISRNLPLLVMIMSWHTPANNMLVAIHQGMPSLAELSVTLVKIRNMRQHDCCAAHVFKIWQFLFQPSEYLSGLFKLRILLKVIEKAKIWIEWYYTC